MSKGQHQRTAMSLSLDAMDMGIDAMGMSQHCPAAALVTRRYEDVLAWA
jgi:hypothetical protein